MQLCQELIKIHEKWEKTINMSCKPAFSKVKENHVFDEDKSVKWNREQVIRNNERYEQEVQRLNTEKNKARDAVYEDIYLYIQKQVGHHLSKEKAKQIWNYIYRRANNNIDALLVVQEMSELLHNIMTPAKQKTSPVKKAMETENDLEDWER